MGVNKKPTKKEIDKVYVIVRYFMQKSRQAKRNDFTNKKVQKLLFYAQAWSLVLNKKPLFNEKFEAWVHGAAIPKVYRTYSKFGTNQIEEEIEVEEFGKILSEEEKDLLDNIWEVYGKYDADYLELLNHQEDPWQNARAGMPAGMASNAVIDEGVMREYYGEKLKRAKQAEKQKITPKPSI